MLTNKKHSSLISYTTVQKTMIHLTMSSGNSLRCWKAQLQDWLEMDSYLLIKSIFNSGHVGQKNSEKRGGIKIKKNPLTLEKDKDKDKDKDKRERCLRVMTQER